MSVPETSTFSKFLFEKYRIGQDRFVIPFDAQRNRTDNMALLIFEKLTASLKLSLRDKEQICIQLKSILLTLKHEKVQLIWLLIILIFKHFHGDSIEQHLFSYTEGKYKEVKSFTLNTFRNSGSGYSPVEVSFFDVAKFYLTLNQESLKQISDRFNMSPEPWQEFILESLTHNKQDGNPITPLSKYELLVQQAGHLG